MIKSLLVFLTFPVFLLFTGCGGGARYVDPTGPNTIVTVNEIDIQDWANAADQMVQNLLASGVLDRSAQQPAVLAISRIVNNTSQQVDTNLLTKQIRVALNQSGKAVTTTTVGLGGTAEDPLAKDQAAYESFRSGGDGSPAVQPGYSLSGRLIETRATAGSVQQMTFTFQLSLTEIATGLAVWEDQVDITKQGRRPRVGW
ncbi:MAG: penicillin-binding protein activator LpoB [Verrucomicrobiota bacterium]